ncbi:receptor-like protein kinase [Tripterygium wilfordii]|uniref:Receptor-like protein kinase n=1 Tax=Tripterygium wilfordii TaxID=458696 RepID=A0A7J7C5Y0_TRIWF|nr:probable receptor-like protein kinase At5g59700 [Tripterygium wilfordii]KAF5729554.1 receptor-like protein kinase [Tripterygium wilfordii]
MWNVRNPELLIWVLSITCLMYVSLAYTPEDNYLIDCGSSTNKSVGDRVFVADNSDSNVLSTPQTIFVNTSSGPAASTNDSVLYETARIFDGASTYTFVIKKQGRLWIRLHFFPFVQNNYNLSMAKFSVTAQNFTLLKDFQVESGSLVKEYSLNITSDKLVLTFDPSVNSFAFINALEVFSLPDELIPLSVRTIGPQSSHQNLQKQALETVSRVNMGNRTVSRQDDDLWRLWVSDDVYLIHSNLAKFVSNVKAVNFSNGRLTEMIAPASVYGTATILNSDGDPRINANITWNFDVDPGFEYLVRFHFCDIVNNSQQTMVFNVYINSWFVYRYFDLRNLTSNVVGSPYALDVVVRVSDNPILNVSVGPSTPGELYPFVILNGLEIMKINNSRSSLDVADSISSTNSKSKVGVIVGLAAGGFVAFVSALVVFLMCRRRKLAHVDHSKEDEEFALRGERKFNADGTTIGYRFPFTAIQEATDNFTESLVIGVGGFGKVYKGVLSDDTKVAVKRGAPQSQQGFAEFRTEIEMLSQFRHRHLVSLIGYCDEGDEMIIIYEYMENGTVKNHLYGSDLPSLSWRQRLKICVGAARGLHYLHTSSAKAIIHRDVKSANILLDENMMAKVADFGLSKTGPGIDETHVSTAVKGSFGYLDPEYLTRQVLTEKSDVYSFGVVMLEVLCGRPVIDPSRPREQVNLIDWAMKWYRHGQLEEIVDPRLSDDIKPESLKKFGEIVEKCLAERGVDRPTMGDVLWNLESALPLQENEEKSIPYGESCSHTNFVNQVENNASTEQFSMVSMGDIADVSMSKVFAQMVREDER